MLKVRAEVAVKVSEYKYDPNGYNDTPGLRAEMEDYYSFLEKYLGEETSVNRSFLDKQRRDLFFSVKHRVVEARLTQAQAQDMRDYFADLFDMAQV